MTDHDGTVFFLPGLGFGAAAAAPLAAALGDRFRVIGIDLLGQGELPDLDHGPVTILADIALRTIETEADGGPWMLVAHSMGGKVAALVGARVLSGEARVFGFVGSVLLAPSPPTPEPMDDDKRALMLSWAEDGALSGADAREFLAQNVANPLSDAAENDAIAQVRAMSPRSWRWWLNEGSRADVSTEVGTLDMPVVVMAGDDDDNLGASAQPGLLGLVYPRAKFVSLADTGHLLPYERVPEVADQVRRFWDETAAVAPCLASEWSRLIASDRTEVEARSLLARRAFADDASYEPRALTAAQLSLLRQLANRLVPQPADRRIDLAARVDADLAADRSDGWRPSELPDDASAYRSGLDQVAAHWPEDADQQDALVRRIIAGDWDEDGSWTGELMSRWFEDVRNDLTRTWVAHPSSLARIGYDGFATSGTVGDRVGYVHLGAGERDDWEPADLGQLVSDTTRNKA